MLLLYCFVGIFVQTKCVTEHNRRKEGYFVLTSSKQFHTRCTDRGAHSDTHSALRVPALFDFMICLVLLCRLGGTNRFAFQFQSTSLNSLVRRSVLLIANPVCSALQGNASSPLFPMHVSLVCYRSVAVSSGVHQPL